MQKMTKPLTKYLLQASVIGLGFGMNFTSVVDAGKTGILFTVLSIFGALGLGFLLGKWLKVAPKIGYLISCGTAICGGSAIAAIAPVIESDEKEMSMSLATVFILNAIALLIFPFIGHYMNLTEWQFGIWSAIAIHDTSSVVGAATTYGGESITIATTIKLARALWIIPLVIFTAIIYRKKTGIKGFPYFILLFLGASMASTYLSIPSSITEHVVRFSKVGLSITLFLIGASISVKSIKDTGWRPLAMGILLWLILLLVTLWTVTKS